MKTDLKSISTLSNAEPRFRTVPQAARETGVPSYKIRRAVKLGIIPSYGVLDHRRYVRIIDIEAAMKCSTAAACEQSSFDFSTAPSSKGDSL